MTVDLSSEEKALIDWLDSMDSYYVTWEQVEEKVREIENISESTPLEEINTTIQPHLKGVTVVLSDEGKSKYPIKDIRNGIYQSHE